MAKVLIVDDSGYARRVHRGILESAGHSVVEASTGMGAVEAFFLEKPELVLLDLSMEDMGGVEVLTRLREIDAESRVIVISADVQRTTEQAVMAAGAKRFLAKPADQAKLLGTVTEVLDAAAEARVKP
jgi:two-component system, chemotaxis family, chemotaxis protein CheY